MEYPRKGLWTIAFVSKERTGGEVEAKTKKQMKDFATFPLKLYKGNKCYVPSIVEDEMVIQDGTKNFAKGNSECRCFLAYKDNKLAGRICAVIAHESNKKFSEKAIRFNRIDFIEDIEGIFFNLFFVKTINLLCGFFVKCLF